MIYFIPLATYILGYMASARWLAIRHRVDPHEGDRHLGIIAALLWPVILAITLLIAIPFGIHWLAVLHTDMTREERKRMKAEKARRELEALEREIFGGL